MARRTGRRTRRRTQGVRPGDAAAVSGASVPGGRLRSLRSSEVALIVGKALAILERTGVAGAPCWLRGLLEENGARVRDDGRVVFAPGRVESALARAARTVALPGFCEDRGIQVGGGHVHVGTGGAAVHVLDGDGATYRPSRLRDLHRMMRVLEACPNIHYGVRPLVARDVEDSFELDVNTAYTCLRATTKPIGVSFDNAAHVAPVVALFDLATGRSEGFRRQPFCMAIIVHVVPPLRFAEEGVAIIRAAIAAGMPLQICSAGQAGATSPAPLAGALAQGLAECLAGMMVVDALGPGHPCIYAFMPFISDLRTGAMSGGSGEGHYLGEAQTRARMRCEYVYPTLGDRRGVGEWIEAGRTSIWNRARDRVAEILAMEPPDHLTPAVDRAIRERYPIRLSEGANEA